MPKTMTAEALENELSFNGVTGTVTKSKGVYTLRRGFFYRSGGSAELLRSRVEIALKAAKLDGQLEITDSGEKDFPFRGGKPLAKQSHWYVVLTPRPENAA